MIQLWKNKVITIGICGKLTASDYIPLSSETQKLTRAIIIFSEEDMDEARKLTSRNSGVKIRSINYYDRNNGYQRIARDLERVVDSNDFWNGKFLEWVHAYQELFRKMEFLSPRIREQLLKEGQKRSFFDEEYLLKLKSLVEKSN